jgi:valyl-tRNA synthetase
LANTSLPQRVEAAPGACSSFRVSKTEFFIPLSEGVDLGAEREKIQKEIDYLKGFLASVDKKLSNERFVSNAPEKVIELERKKAADAQEKIEGLEKSLGLLQ